MAVKMLMKGAILPGNSTVELKDFEIPKPGYGQVVVQTVHLMQLSKRVSFMAGLRQGRGSVWRRAAR